MTEPDWIARVKCQPGDVLVVSWEQILPHEAMQEIREGLIAAVGQDVRVVVLCGGPKLSVFSNAA